MENCLVSFGANIGDAAGTIRDAAKELEKLTSSAGGCTFQLSRLFRTPPVGGPSGQPPFINAVAAIHTSLSPWQLWSAVRQVEQQFGRQRNLRWEARKLDLDILLFGQERIWTPQLKIPHPRMCMRRFILMPACDVAADWIDPVSRSSIFELSSRLKSGPASLCLIGHQHSAATSILAEAARQAKATWLRPESNCDAIKNPDQSRVHRNASRWVQFVPRPASEDSSKSTSGENFGNYLNNSFHQVSDAEPCLAVCLAEPEPAPSEHSNGLQGKEAAWEDVYRNLATRLNLLASSPNRPPPLEYVGGRYLLPADDLDWATHELVAALDAMDCPVEPLE